MFSVLEINLKLELELDHEDLAKLYFLDQSKFLVSKV